MSVWSGIGSAFYVAGVCFAAMIVVYILTRLVTAAFYRSKKEFK